MLVVLFSYQALEMCRKNTTKSLNHTTKHRWWGGERGLDLAGWEILVSMAHTHTHSESHLMEWKVTFSSTLVVQASLCRLSLYGQVMGELALVPLGALALLEKGTQDRLWVHTCQQKKIDSLKKEKLCVCKCVTVSVCAHTFWSAVYPYTTKLCPSGWQHSVN